VSYVLLAAFIVFNLLIGIVIGSMEKARQHEAKNMPADAEEASLSEPALLDRIALLQASLCELEADLRRRDRQETSSTRD